MKEIVLIIFLAVFIDCIGQSSKKNIYIKNNTPEELISVENELFQYVENEIKDSVTKVSTWDEFNENKEDRDSIPEKVFVKTSFHIDPEWAGEKIPFEKVLFKTTIQLIYGKAAIGDNVCNPTVGNEITLLSGSFTGKDMEKMFLNSLNFSGIKFKTSDFSLRSYLITNRVRLFYTQEQQIILGRIVIRTYYGSKPKNLNIKYEKVMNVIKNQFED